MPLVFLYLACSLSTPDAVASPSGRADAGSGSLAAYGSSRAETSPRVIWGIYEITLDPETLTADVVPSRLAMGHFNVRRFLEEAPCSHCLVLTKIKMLGPREFEVDAQLRHPFVGHNYYTGFDVRGTVMFDGSFSFPGSGLSFPDPEDPDSGALLNPDGYTTLFNPTDYPPGSQQWPALEYQKGRYATDLFPTATLNPYIYYCPDVPRRYFGSTSVITRTYHIRLPSGQPLRFGYVIDANWALPVANPPKVPDDFPLAANMPEPYRIDMHVIGNNLWSEEGVGGGGSIRFSLKVYDHQDPRREQDGGTIKGFFWEIAGMTGWNAITPDAWSSGSDSVGSYAVYEFLEAPVPDAPGPHKCLIGVVDKEPGIKGIQETAYMLTAVQVQQGQSCWSPGEMVSDIPSSSYQAHLNNAQCTFVDDEGIFHLFYLDRKWEIHHLQHQGGIVSDEIIIPDEKGYNLNAVPDSLGNIHLAYADNPDMEGGNVVYRMISPDGEVGPPVNLTASPRVYQYEVALAVAPDSQILVLWMDTAAYPNRRLKGGWFNGSFWVTAMEFAQCYLPNSWIDPSVVADSSGVFHFVYCDNDPSDVFYFQFSNGWTSPRVTLIDGPQTSCNGRLSIDSNDRIYMTFEDDRTGGRRGWLMMRDPVTGGWTPEIDMVGYNHANNRYQNIPLPDGRLAVVWTDWRDETRGLYSKVFDPFLSEAQIQAIPDDEIDAFYSELKNQTRLCLDQNGTLHLVWSDHRAEDHWQLIYSTCTP